MDHEHFRLKLLYKQKKKVSQELKEAKTEIKGLEVSRLRYVLEHMNVKYEKTKHIILFSVCFYE